MYLLLEYKQNTEPFHAVCNSCVRILHNGLLHSGISKQQGRDHLKSTNIRTEHYIPGAKEVKKGTEAN